MPSVSSHPQKKRHELRFEREAKALRKNLEKRKLQQEKRENLKQADKAGCEPNCKE